MFRERRKTRKSEAPPDANLSFSFVQLVQKQAHTNPVKMRTDPESIKEPCESSPVCILPPGLRYVSDDKALYCTCSYLLLHPIRYVPSLLTATCPGAGWSNNQIHPSTILKLLFGSPSSIKCPLVQRNDLGVPEPTIQESERKRL